MDSNHDFSKDQIQFNVEIAGVRYNFYNALSMIRFLNKLNLKEDIKFCIKFNDRKGEYIVHTATGDMKNYISTKTLEMIENILNDHINRYPMQDYKYLATANFYTCDNEVISNPSVTILKFNKEETTGINEPVEVFNSLEVRDINRIQDPIFLYIFILFMNLIGCPIGR